MVSEAGTAVLVHALGSFSSSMFWLSPSRPPPRLRPGAFSKTSGSHLAQEVGLKR